MMCKLMPNLLYLATRGFRFDFLKRVKKHDGIKIVG